MYICRYCNKEIKYHQHQIRCTKNPNRDEILKRASIKGKKLSREAKKNISLGRIKYLKNNKNKHNWSIYRNKESYPEKLFREQLEKIENIKFYQYYRPEEFNKNYELDFVIINKKICFEINGYQHYTKSGKLKKYYKIRHDYIKSFGWEIIEISYLNCFDAENIKKIIENSINNIKFTDLKINDVINHKKLRKLNKKNKRTRKQYFDDVKNNYNNSQQQYVDKVLNSKMDFSKFGWVNKVSEIINQKPQKVNRWMKRFLPEFYKEKCFKRMSS